MSCDVDSSSRGRAPDGARIRVVLRFGAAVRYAASWDAGRLTSSSSSSECFPFDPECLSEDFLCDLPPPPPPVVETVALTLVTVTATVALAVETAAVAFAVETAAVAFAVDTAAVALSTALVEFALDVFVVVPASVFLWWIDESVSS